MFATANKPQQSHTAEFTALDLARLVAATALPVLLLAGIIHGIAALGWLPRPKPLLDIDRTILLHQASAAEQGGQASLLLIGDSSCLMDAAPLKLQLALGVETRNLATLSYVDLVTQARLASNYWHHASTPEPITRTLDRPRTVLLLMHPDALRLGELPEQHSEIIDDFWAKRDASRGASERWTIPERAMAVDVLQGRLIGRALPRALPARFGDAYGFTHSLWHAMDLEAGGVIDPNEYTTASGAGRPEYRIAARAERESRAFKRLLPASVKLVVGLTPLPEGFAEGGYPDVARLLLTRWAGYLGADLALMDLPATMPDRYFASTTHLNANGRGLFSSHLAGALRTAGYPRLAPPPATGRIP